MKELFDLINKLRNRIKKYESLLRTNEALTRYVLIDPLLRVLDWDIENPDIVRPEERQESGRPDYVLYCNGRKLIALEVKSLGLKLDEKKALDLGFSYSWKNKIPYFIITDGNVWKVYDVKKMGGELILEVNMLKDPIEDIVRKLLSLWRPLIKDSKIEPLKPTIQPKQPSPDLDKVKRFYKLLNYKEKMFLKIVFEAWKQGRKLTKNELINELKKRGVTVDEMGFTGIKSGITRLSKRMGLSPPMPTANELREEYWKIETKRYVLKDEWGQALEEVIEMEETI